jgi:hypothetical protein
MADDATRELPQSGGDQPSATPAPATGLRGLLATRRGRTTGFAALGVLLLAAVVALTWGLVGGGGSPRNQDAASAASVTTQQTTPPAATSSAAPTSGSAAPSSAQTAVTAAGPTTAAVPAATTAAGGGGAAAGAAAPWCTSNCTATTPQRAIELAVMALQANDMDAYRSVTIDMDPADLRAAMADGALTVRSCTTDSGDADCAATFGSTAFDVGVSQLPQDPDEPPKDMPWGVVYVQSN